MLIFMTFNQDNTTKSEKFFKSISNSLIYSNYYKDVDENLVYFESMDGNDFAGNIFRIAEELSTGNYGNFKIAVYAKPEVKGKIDALKKNYNLKIDKIITDEDKATRLLEKAKYIFTDYGIRPKYVKKNNQVFIHTGHGTPFKLTGFDYFAQRYKIGDFQHPFLSSDYMLFHNQHMMEKILNSHMIDTLYPGKILLEGCPRNSVFFKGSKLKEKLDLQNKEIFVYMPTYRGILNEDFPDTFAKTLEDYFVELDSKLKDNQILFVKLHPFTESEINYSKFNNIRSFPEGYESYDVLNMADILITDYSNIFFDFANSKRKIILFNHDEKEFMSYRGTYFQLSHLPFPKVQNIDELIHELNCDKDYDETEFIEKFCPYDNQNAVENICNHIFNHKEICQEKNIENDKPNILIYAGDLFKNGITSSLVSMLANVDLSKYNIYISFRQEEGNIRYNHEESLSVFSSDVKFLPMRSGINMTYSEEKAYDKFFDNDELCMDADYPEILDKMFKREINRLYPNITFDKMINFDGYGVDQILLYKNMDCENYIWVHSDMIQETKTRSTQKLFVLREAYNKYENVVAVSPDLIESIREIADNDIDVGVVHNIANYQGIIKRSKKDIIFDRKTVIDSNHLGGLDDVLNGPGKKFICIGRFTAEKGFERLILAFNEFYKDYPDAQLIIVGSRGRDYDDFLELRKSLPCWKNVTVIKFISNPMPILKRCDLYVSPSLYEGWSMVIMEADILNVPVISTDVTGVQWIRNYGGYMVEDSKEGILQGFHDFMEGKVKVMDVDYEEYNQNAIREFKEILN